MLKTANFTNSIERLKTIPICTNCVKVCYPILVEWDDGSTGELWECIVVSYGTNIARMDVNGVCHRLWMGWSATSQRHLNKAINGLNMTKKVWDSMEVE